jgi:adenine-specific DNA methylase
MKQKGASVNSTQVEITAAMATERPDLKPLIGQRLTVIAWLWARTVKSPNPDFMGCSPCSKFLACK